MKAIDFVVRDGAGALQRGVVPAEASSHVIQAQQGQEISLNLRQTDLAGQQRTGNDLVITLADGRVIMVENYFNDAGEANRLFISADGYLNEVSLIDQGAGELYAQYGPTEAWGKWSPSDDLIYLGRTETAGITTPVGAADDEVSMLGAGLLGGGLLGGGAAAAAAIAGGGLLLGGGGDPGPRDPFVNNADDSNDVGGDNTDDHVLVVTGGGEPGSTVEVTVGNQVVDTVIGDDGTFSATFEDDNFPTDGTHNAVVVVTDAEGVPVSLNGPQFIIDTIAPTIVITEGVQSVGDIFNGSEFENGVTLTGTGEAGATLDVTLGGVTRSTVVDTEGSWTVTWENGVFDPGEYSSDLVIVASDSFGNTSTLTDTVVIDTETTVTVTSNSGGDDAVINAVEHEAGVSLVGTAEGGATVEVTWGTTTRVVTADSDGSWTATFTSTEVEPGEYTQTVTVTSTDIAGNSSSTSATVNVDTIGLVTVDTTTIATDGVINTAEHTNGVTVTGTTQVGSSVQVTFGSVTLPATVDASGNWTVDFASADIPAGEYTATITAVSTDAAGNTASASGTVEVDTEAAVTINSNTVETDGTVNETEASDGVTITGSSQPGSSVEVTFGGTTHSATVASDGSWTVDFAASEVTPGEYDATVTAVATDINGNSTSTSGTIHVDTISTVTVETAGVEIDGVVNQIEASDGVTLTGTTQPGSTVEVTVGSVTHTATVGTTGTWSVDFAASDIPAGEYITSVTAVATDAAGNSSTATGAFDVDTVGNVTIGTSGTGSDAYINEVERADGITLTGTTQPGSTVEVTFGSSTQTALVSSIGTWNVDFPAGAIPEGEQEVIATARATDPAGNVSVSETTVSVDTVVRDFANTSTPGGDDAVINATEATAGLVMNGTVEAGSTVTVEMGGVIRTATVSSTGGWTANFGASDIAPGEYTSTVTITATDRAGNVSSLTQDVNVDTVAGVLTISPEPVETDDIVNEAEASDGVMLSGTADAGATVTVTMAGVSHQVVANGSGIWQAFYAANEVAPGDYVADIHATTTDAAGNSREATDSVRVDTRVDNLSIAADIIEGDNMVSGAEQEDGVVITGTTEIGSTLVEVTVGGETVTATVDALGNWSATFSADAFPTGELTADISVTATDAAGNSATVTDTVEVDTLVNRLTLGEGAGGADGVLSADEAAQGLDLGGQVEAGSSVVVVFDGTSYTANVDAAGNWSVEIPASAIRQGTYEADIEVMATDAVGNTESLTDVLPIDTDAPDGPVVASFTRDGDGIRGISTEGLSANSEDALEISQVNANGTISDVSAASTDIAPLNETAYTFDANVPDGSHLVVTNTDAAGNTSGTYLVLDDESVNSDVSLANNGLGNYQIETVDLQFAEAANLTLDAASLEALSTNTNTLTVNGGSDDTVTITGATRGSSAGGYTDYTLGDEGIVRIDDDISVTI